jgi:hypothetical protein
MANPVYVFYGIYCPFTPVPLARVPLSQNANRKPTFLIGCRQSSKGIVYVFIQQNHLLFYAL